MILIRILIVLTLAYMIFIGFLFFRQEKLIFPAGQESFNDCQEMIKLGAIPQSRGQIRFYQRKLEQSFGSVFYFHGNAGRACERSFFLFNLYELPYDFYFYEYPGYAGDSRAPNEKHILAEALEFFDQVRGPNPAVLFGESLGSGIATYVASQRHAQVQGLILQAPYTSMAELAQYHYPYIPAKLLIRHSFPAKEWAQLIPERLQALFFIAENDRTVPPNFSYELAKNFKMQPIIKFFPGSRHSSMDDDHPELYWNSIADYLESTLMNTKSRGKDEN